LNLLELGDSQKSSQKIVKKYSGFSGNNLGINLSISNGIKG
jgi:hypothetical protein